MIGRHDVAGLEQHDVARHELARRDELRRCRRGARARSGAASARSAATARSARYSCTKPIAALSTTITTITACVPFAEQRRDDRGDQSTTIMKSVNCASSIARASPALLQASRWVPSSRAWCSPQRGRGRRPRSSAARRERAASRARTSRARTRGRAQGDRRWRCVRASSFSAWENAKRDATTRTTRAARAPVAGGTLPRVGRSDAARGRRSRE